MSAAVPELPCDAGAGSRLDGDAARRSAPDRDHRRGSAQPPAEHAVGADRQDRAAVVLGADGPAATLFLGQGADVTLDAERRGELGDAIRIGLLPGSEVPRRGRAVEAGSSPS